jgi:hypothetical protein
MSGFIPPWSPWYTARPRGPMAGPDMRVSDAERAEMADALSKHYADGRLDEAEFNERLHQAMSAKTRSDLSGLLIDLPPVIQPPRPQVEVHHRRRTMWLVIGAVLLFAVLTSPWPWSWGAWHVPWFLVAVVAFIVWRRSKWGWHRHRHIGYHGHAPMAGGPGPWAGPGSGPGPGPGPGPDGGPYPGSYSGRGRGWWV